MGCWRGWLGGQRVEGQSRMRWEDERLGNHSTAACAFPVSCPFSDRPPSLSKHMCVCANDNQLDLGPRNSKPGTRLPESTNPGLRGTLYCGLHSALCVIMRKWRPNRCPLLGGITGNWRRHLCSKGKSNSNSNSKAATSLHS